MAKYISDAEDAEQHNSRPEDQTKESPSQLLVIVDRFSG